MRFSAIILQLCGIQNFHLLRHGTESATQYLWWIYYSFLMASSFICA